MLGVIHHAHAEFNKLSDIAHVTVRCTSESQHVSHESLEN